MNGPNEVIENVVVRSNRRDSDVIPLEESIAKSKSYDYSVEKKKSLRARYIYGFVFLLTNLLAWIVRDYGHKALAKLRYQQACQGGGHKCFYTEGVLRVSLGCFIFFLGMFVTTFRARKLYEAQNTWHTGWWALKFILLIASMVVPFFIPLAFIKLYGEFARIGAGVFLLLQLISVIHFITWWNNYWMPDEKLKQSCFFGLFMATISYIASICGIILMYVWYAPRPSCSLNIFFISWTIILVSVMMVVSLHSKVNSGLLSSGIIGSYVVFLCWSALRSVPATGKCNKQNENDGSCDWMAVVGFLIAICAIVMATFSTGIDSQSFQFRKDEVQSEDDIPYKYGFFHLIFSMGAMYFAMLFISWELDHSTHKWSIDIGWASTWVKIINEWFAATIYLWILISPLLRRTKAMDDDRPVQQIHGSV